MTTYGGGTQVPSGYYIDRKSFAFVNVETGGTTLPGGPDTRYVRVPVMAVMAAAPALGGLLVIALPFIGAGMTAYALARKLGARAKAGAAEVAATIAMPAAAPGQAHLTGGAVERGAQDAASAQGPAVATRDEPLDELAKEIERQRGTVY